MIDNSIDQVLTSFLFIWFLYCPITLQNLVAKDKNSVQNNVCRWDKFVDLQSFNFLKSSFKYEPAYLTFFVGLELSNINSTFGESLILSFEC